MLVSPAFLIMIFAAIRAHSLQELLSRVNALAPLKKRAVSAVIGAAVGDAASRPMHWLYDRKTLEEIVGVKDPAFWPESVSPFYTLPTGRRSCYNEVAYAMLRALPTDNKVLFDSGEYLSSLADFFGAESEYAIAFKKRQEAYDPSKKLEERKPIEGPWQHQAVTVLMGHLDKGEDITGNPSLPETDGFCSIIPLIARVSACSSDGLRTAIGKVIPASALLSSNVLSVKHAMAATAMLRHAILFEEFDAGVMDELMMVLEDSKDIAAEVTVVKSWRGKDYSDANDSFGKGCSNPGSFQGAVLATITSSSYAECIRKIAKGGGCNCSRANLAGAVLGAVHGLGGDKGIPLSWIEKTDKIAEIIELALERVAMQPASK